jgi:hypothetical protein
MKVRVPDVLAWVRGQSKMSQALGKFGLLDFTMLRPVLAWRILKLIKRLFVSFFNFLFLAAVKRG